MSEIFQSCSCGQENPAPCVHGAAMAVTMSRVAALQNAAWPRIVLACHNSPGAWMVIRPSGRSVTKCRNRFMELETSRRQHTCPDYVLEVGVDETTDLDKVIERFRASEVERAIVDRDEPWASVGPLRRVRVEKQLASSSSDHDPNVARWPTVSMVGAPTTWAEVLASGSGVNIIAQVPFENVSMSHCVRAMMEYWGVERFPAVEATTYKFVNGRLRHVYPGMSARRQRGEEGQGSMQPRVTRYTMSTMNRMACTCKNLNRWFFSNFDPKRGSTDEPETP